MTRPAAPRGLFITLEGIDGSGKTTQAERLVDLIREAGVAVVRTREPGGTEVGREMRKLLLDQDRRSLSHRAELLLMAADRAEHVEQVIRPALAAGKVVVSDRYADSTLAYQGYGNGDDLTLVQNVVDYACDGAIPDLTLLLDCPVAVGLERRMTARGGEITRIDVRDHAYHTQVRTGYLKVAAANTRRITVIDADRDADAVTRHIARVVTPLLCFGRDSGTLVLERALAVA